MCAEINQKPEVNQKKDIGVLKHPEAVNRDNSKISNLVLDSLSEVYGKPFSEAEAEEVLLKIVSDISKELSLDITNAKNIESQITQIREELLSKDILFDVNILPGVNVPSNRYVVGTVLKILGSEVINTSRLKNPLKIIKPPEKEIRFYYADNFKNDTTIGEGRTYGMTLSPIKEKPMIAVFPLTQQKAVNDGLISNAVHKTTILNEIGNYNANYGIPQSDRFSSRPLGLEQTQSGELMPVTFRFFSEAYSDYFQINNSTPADALEIFERRLKYSAGNYPLTRDIMNSVFQAALNGQIPSLQEAARLTLSRPPSGRGYSVIDLASSLKELSGESPSLMSRTPTSSLRSELLQAYKHRLSPYLDQVNQLKK